MFFQESLSTASFAVIDVETTGLDPKTDRVVEVACLRVREGRIVDRFSSLVNPQRPIARRASEIHGIFDCDVVGAPTLPELSTRIVAMTAGSIVVAHNARFDVAFLPFIAGRPALCTLQLARRLVDAPNYRNETLRQILRLDVGHHHTAHRAAADAEVTAALLLELLRRYEYGPYRRTVPALFETLSRPARLERFAFGRHYGKSVATIPTAYLRWVVEADFSNWPDVRHTALIELQRRSCDAFDSHPAQPSRCTTAREVA